MTTDAKALATSYFNAWKNKDFETLRSLLADDVTFVGSMGTANGPDECVQGMAGMSKQMDDIVIRAIVADDSDVITWYDLHMSGVEPMATANWSHVEDDKITAIRATFDPRPLLDAAKR